MHTMWLSHECSNVKSIQGCSTVTNPTLGPYCIIFLLRCCGLQRINRKLSIISGAYPGGRTPGGPSESLILAPSELKNFALTPPLNMTRCETRHWNFVNMSEIFIQTYMF